MSETTAPDATDRAIAVINVFTPKPGQLDAFVALQQAALPGLRGTVAGLRGSRFYRARDGRNAVLVSAFDSKDDFQRFLQSDAFAAHRDRIAPLLERTDPSLYELIYEAGQL